MGLFDKKYCDICGEKIGLLGNRKLEDGNLCKHCANKLSYWFDGRRHSTVEEIRSQLAYREENRQKVQAFNVTRSIGRGTKVLLDENKGLFMIARTNDLAAENPDVLDLSLVTGCDLNIEEDRTEEMRTLDDGSEVSYNPPRYSWHYQFNMAVHVNHPYFDSMDFCLNPSTVDVEPTGSAFSGRNFDPRRQRAYLEYEQMGEEIKEALTAVRTGLREMAAEAAKPKEPTVCPACGATTVPDAKGCCEYCGRPLG